MKRLKFFVLPVIIFSFAACAQSATNKTNTHKSLKVCSATYPPVCYDVG